MISPRSCAISTRRLKAFNSLGNGSIVTRSETNSNASSKPLPRTSPINGYLSINAVSRAFRASPIDAAFSTRFCRVSSSRTAAPAAQASGLPAYVNPCKKPPEPKTASTISALATIAPSGAYPAPKPLDKATMSGVTPQCSEATNRPVRPAPVITSS